MKIILQKILAVYFRKIALLLVVGGVTITNTTGAVFALSESANRALNYGANWFNPESAGSLYCEVSTGISSATNFDYAGNQILSDAQIAAIQENSPIYKQAAQKVDIPWQMIAVIHLRETGLKLYNPSNGQGVYQFVDGNGGPYPTGDVDEAEFLRQTILAAEFIKSKAALNYPANRTLTATSGPEVIKDTFFGYNGRSAAYVRQAQTLGYSATEGYEGSPYVMNKADAIRDPLVNETTWGQIKTDFGGLVYPANNDYGAYVVYASIAGVSLSGDCSSTLSGTTREKVVNIAREELSLWAMGQMRPKITLGPGDDATTKTYNKYSYEVNNDWCAFFASWVYNKAGYPLSAAENGVVSLVSDVRSIGEAGGTFTYHSVESGYIPQPGDLVIQKNGVSHTNIVVAVEGDMIEVIGGNQGTTCSGTTSFLCSSVTSYKMKITALNNTGFVSPTN